MLPSHRSRSDSDTARRVRLLIVGNAWRLIGRVLSKRYVGFRALSAC